MFKTIGIILLVLIAGVLVMAARKPDTVRIERSADIDAPPDRIYELLADFHRWPAWSPWEKLDPAMKRTLSGADRGKGAIYAWSGNSKAGAGRMEILDTQPASRVTIQLDFIEPMRTRNTVEFALRPQGGGTHVNWSMTGPAPFISKLMSVFCDMDKMIGKDFEAGFANLKSLTESAAPTPST